MSFLGRLVTLYPAIHGAGIISSLIFFVFEPGPLTLALIPLTIYLFPLVCFHVHQWVAPVKEGDSSLVGSYSPWYGTHMIQTVFIAFPGTERILRLVPGLFSLWLRCWGSKVGRNVYWTPHFEVADRGLLEIGDNVVFGYNVKVACHVISPSREMGLKLYIKKCVMEDRSFLGATASLAPGVLVREGALVKATTNVYPDTIIERS